MAKTYSPKKVQVIVNGVPLTGFADGSFVEVEMSADAFTMVIGADGEGARAASADQSGTVTVRLLQTSAGNDVLSALLTADRLTQLGTFSLIVKDVSGTSLVLAQQAWVKKMANITFDKEIQAREWVIESDLLNVFAGGNPL